MNVVTDAVSFLWRAELAGEPRSAQHWREVHDHALRSFPQAGVAYADVHSLLSCVAESDLPSMERMLPEVRQRIAADHYPPGEVVIWLAEGTAACAAGRWNDAIRCLNGE